jgi:hypothetical protein
MKYPVMKREFQSTFSIGFNITNQFLIKIFIDRFIIFNYQ